MYQSPSLVTALLKIAVVLTLLSVLIYYIIREQGLESIGTLALLIVTASAMMYCSGDILTIPVGELVKNNFLTFCIVICFPGILFLIVLGAGIAAYDKEKREQQNLLENIGEQ